MILPSDRPRATPHRLSFDLPSGVRLQWSTFAATLYSPSTPVRTMPFRSPAVSSTFHWAYFRQCPSTGSATRWMASTCMSGLPSASLGLPTTVPYNSNSRGVTPAGSFSLLFTSNGVSSEDIDPTGGRYGYVALRASIRSGKNPPSSPAINLWTNLLVGRFIPSRASPRSQP